MGKKRSQNKDFNKKKPYVSSRNRIKKTNRKHHSSGDTKLSSIKTKEQSNQFNNNKLEKVKNDDICSICLNQIKKPSLCSGCLHYFCFFCITKWSNLSNSCPVCRKQYKNILHNFSSSVRIIRIEEETDQEKCVIQNEEIDGQEECIILSDEIVDQEKCVVQSDSEEDNNRLNDPFYIIETGNQQMIGVPIINKEKLTSNIVILDTNNENKIPEIDILNLTKKANGSQIITRHNYQLASADQQELINGLISSAVNRSVEEHNETIAQIESNSKELEQSRSNLLNEDKDLTRLIDVYTFDRTNQQRGRNRSTVESRYNLRPIEGTRTNPFVDRTRITESFEPIP